MPVVGTHTGVDVLMRRRRTNPKTVPCFPRARIFFPLATRFIRVSLTDYNLPASCLPRQFIFGQLASTYAFSANVRLLGDEPGRGLQLKLIWLTFWKRARTMVGAQPEMLLATVLGRNFVRFCSLFQRDSFRCIVTSPPPVFLDLRNVSFAWKYEYRGEKRKKNSSG